MTASGHTQSEHIESAGLRSNARKCRRLDRTALGGEDQSRQRRAGIQTVAARRVTEMVEVAAERVYLPNQELFQR